MLKQLFEIKHLNKRVGNIYCMSNLDAICRKKETGSYICLVSVITDTYECYAHGSLVTQVSTFFDLLKLFKLKKKHFIMRNMALDIKQSVGALSFC